MYDFEKLLEKEIRILKKKLNKKDIPIAIQIPEGLKTKATFILEKLKDYKPRMFIDACYGACDLKDLQAKELDCKAIVHFGHQPMGEKHKIKTIFVPISYKLNKKDIDFIVKEIIQRYTNKKINLLTTAQYLKNIEDIKKEILKQNKKIKIENLKKTKRVEKHMVLGCDCSTVINKNAEMVFIGDGTFHAINLFFKYNKEIFIINPITKETTTLDKEDRFLRQRYGVIALAKKANSFGIVVTTKKYQNRLSSAEEIYKLLLKQKKKAYILFCDEVKNDSLLGLNVDCYINTACPRITYDDYRNYSKPIISIQEAKIILNKKKKLEIDQIDY